MTTPKIASSIDLSLPSSKQKAISTTTALAKPVLITKEQLSSPDEHVKQLNAMNLALQQVSQAQRSHPEQAPITFKNVSCGATGKVILAHNFGRNADYIVTKWKGGGVVTAPILICDENDVSGVVTDKNTLALRSLVAGIANIRVFPGT